MTKSKKNWIIVDPQIVIDHENDDEAFYQLEIEVGRMLSGGMSTYVRPGFGIGDDKLMDWNIEVGLKIIF